MKKLLAALCAVWIAFVPNIALAQIPAAAKTEGQSQSNGGIYTGVGYWDGTSWHAGRSDANGIQRMTEEYPFQLQNDAFPAADTTVAVTNGVLKPIGLGWSVSPFGARTVKVTMSRNGVATKLKLYLYGSDDNVNYYPVMIQSGVWTISDADSNKADTLQVVIGTQQFPGANGGSNTVRVFKLALPEDLYYGRYVQIWATRTDSALASSAIKLGLTYEGRWR